jgi:hypothetical protein
MLVAHGLFTGTDNLLHSGHLTRSSPNFGGITSASSTWQVLHVLSSSIILIQPMSISQTRNNSDTPLRSSCHSMANPNPQANPISISDGRIPMSKRVFPMLMSYHSWRYYRLTTIPTSLSVPCHLYTFFYRAKMTGGFVRSEIDIVFTQFFQTGFMSAVT